MTKFKLKETVNFNGNEETIKTAKKDFKNQSIIYVFDSGITATEKELIAQNKQIVNEITIEDLRAKYNELYGKVAPYQYKNNAVWLTEKIKQKTEAETKEELTPVQKENILESLLVMDLEELTETAKKFDIAISETDATDTLLKKICSLLEIDIDNI